MLHAKSSRISCEQSSPLSNLTTSDSHVSAVCELLEFVRHDLTVRRFSLLSKYAEYRKVRLSLTAGWQSILNNAQFAKAIETVARALNVEGQPITVDVREFIRILVQSGFHTSEFYDPERPHALGAQMTDLAGWIKVTMARCSSDKLLSLDEVVVNKLVIDIFKSKVSALAIVPFDPIPWQLIKELADKYVMHDFNHVFSAKTK